MAFTETSSSLPTVTIIIIVCIALFITMVSCFCVFCCRKRFCRRQGINMQLVSRRSKNKGCCSCFAIPRYRNVKPEVLHNRKIQERKCLRMLLGCVSCFFKSCFIGCDFKGRMSITDAIQRYNEFTDFQEVTGLDFFSKMRKDSMLKIVLEVLNYNMPDFFFTVFPTGSLREKFGKYKPSTSILATDYDLMLIPDGVAVEEDENRVTDSRTPIMFRTVTNTNEIPPGYLWLKLANDSLENWNSLCYKRINQDGNTVERYLSQLSVYNLIRSSIGTEKNLGFFAAKSYDATSIEVDVRRSGPAINVSVKGKDMRKTDPDSKDELFDADFTFGLYCPKLPLVAIERIDELKNRRWPGKDVISRIYKLGCHVVPKPSRQGMTVVTKEQEINSHLASSSALEFRYSFSQAELLLADVVPDIFRRCYMAFKALIKYNINYCPDRVCIKSLGEFHEIPSFVLKTILFETLADVGPYAFSEDTMGECLLEMVNRLKKCIFEKSCPMFWNRQINLLENLDDDDYYFMNMKLDIMLSGKLETLKQFLVDDWLEIQRCIRINCCACYMTKDKLVTIIEDSENETLCLNRPNIRMEYGHWSCCGPLAFEESAIGVY